MSTDIPHARHLLRRIATEIEEHAPSQAARIRLICDEFMTRRPISRRAPSTRSVVTPEIEASVLDMLANTDLPQEAIGRRHNIDGGRVSEIANRGRNR